MASPNYYAGVRDASAQAYEPGLPSTIAGNDVQSLQAELGRVSRAAVTWTNLIPQVATTEPTDPVHGMVRYAKAPWDPTGKGDGWVQYINGAWTNWPNNVLGSLTLNGNLVQASGQILLANGTAAAPSIAFSAATQNGIYRDASGHLAVTRNGTTRQNWTTTGSSITGLLTVSNGLTVSAGATTLSGAPTSALHAATKQYVDDTPTNKASAVQGAWGAATYSPGAADELFFSVNIPTNTRHILGVVFARASAGSAAWTTAYYTVKVFNGSSVELGSNQVAILSVHNTVDVVEATGGHFAFQFASGAITSGSQLRFYVRNPDTPNLHYVEQYSASALCITS